MDTDLITFAISAPPFIGVDKPDVAMGLDVAVGGKSGAVEECADSIRVGRASLCHQVYTKYGALVQRVSFVRIGVTLFALEAGLGLVPMVHLIHGGPGQEFPGMVRGTGRSYRTPTSVMRIIVVNGSGRLSR
jgi:hypothetical protein